MIRAVQVLGLTAALAACATAPGPAPYSPSQARTSIVGNATAMLGQPYRYGGAAPGGFDCSGLVVYATGGAGLQLPRTAQEQLHSGLPVARRNVQAGDLVFMHLAHKELHVGIALDGDRFVHAPSRGGHVRIDSLNSPPYARGFLAARRIIDGAAAAPAARAASGI
ncbi:MAG: C40 family peptidase [Pseudomonadota bacterium]|nr:C40 family peptidase [Pseudomonadota bacterium]